MAVKAPSKKQSKTEAAPKKAKATEPTPEPKKNGRPLDSGKKPTEEQIASIKNYARIRLSLEEISYLIGVTKRMLCRWMNKYPELSVTIKKERSSSKAHAVRSAYLRAFPLPEQVYDESGKPVYDKHGQPVTRMPKGDTVLAIFLLKTMFNFKEPDRKIQVTGKKGDSEIVFNIAGNRLNPGEIVEEFSNHYDDK